MQYPYAVKRYLEPLYSNDVYHKTFRSNNQIELEDIVVTHFGHLNEKIGSQSVNLHINNKFIGITTLFGDNKNSYFTLKKNLVTKISKLKRRVKLKCVEVENLKHPLRQLLTDRILINALKDINVINDNSKTAVVFWSVAASIAAIVDLLVMMLNDKYLNSHWLLLVTILLIMSTLSIAAVFKSGGARKKLLEKQISTLESNGSDEEVEKFCSNVYVTVSRQALRRNASKRLQEKEIVLIENLSVSGNLLKQYLQFLLSCSHKKGCLENKIWICFENQEEPYILNYRQAIEQYNFRLIKYYIYRQVPLASNDIVRISFDLNLHNETQHDFYKQVGIDYLLEPLYRETVQNYADSLWRHSSASSNKVQQNLVRKLVTYKDIKALYIYSKVSGFFLQSFRKQDIFELFQRSQSFGSLNIPNTVFVFAKKEISKKEASIISKQICTDFSDWMIDVKSDLVSVRYYCCSYLLYTATNNVIIQNFANEKCELDLWILMYLIEHPLIFELYSFAWYDFAVSFLSIDSSRLNEFTLYISVANAMLRLMEKSGCFIFHLSILSKITQVLAEQEKSMTFLQNEYFSDFQNHFFHLLLTNKSDSCIILHYKFIQLFADKFTQSRVEPEMDAGILDFNAFFNKKGFGYVKPNFYFNLMFKQKDPCLSFFGSMQYFYAFIQDSGEGCTYKNLYHKELHNTLLFSELAHCISYPVSGYCRMIYSLMQLICLAINPEFDNERTEINVTIIRYSLEYAKRWSEIIESTKSAIKIQLHQSSKRFRATAIVCQHLTDVLNKRFHSKLCRLNERNKDEDDDSIIDRDKLLLDNLILTSSNEGIVQICYYLVMLKRENALYNAIESELKKPLAESIQSASIISLLKYEAFNHITQAIDSCIIPCYYNFILNGSFKDDVKMACILKYLGKGTVGDEILRLYITANKSIAKEYTCRALEALLQNSPIETDEVYDSLVSARHINDRELHCCLSDLASRIAAQTDDPVCKSIASFAKTFLLNELIEDLSLEDLDGAMRVLPVGAYRMGLLYEYAKHDMKYALMLPKHLDSFKVDSTDSCESVLNIYLKILKIEELEIDVEVKNAFITYLENPFIRTKHECLILLKCLYELADPNLDNIKQMIYEKICYLDYIEFLSTMFFEVTTLPFAALCYNRLLISALIEATKGIALDCEDDCHLLENCIKSNTYKTEIYLFAVHICTTRPIINVSSMENKIAIILESMLAFNYLCKFPEANEEISAEDIRELLINQYNWSKQLLEALIRQDSIDEHRKQIYCEAINTLENCLVSTCIIPIN